MQPKKPDTRITFTHGRAQFCVQPKNAQRVRDALFALDRAKPKKPKVPKATDTGYPAFAPGMTTSEYIKQFQQLNGTTGGIPEEIKLRRLAFTHADRAAPMPDPLFPEVSEQVDPDYVQRSAPAKRSSGAATRMTALRARVAELEAEVAGLRQQLTADLV